MRGATLLTIPPFLARTSFRVMSDEAWKSEVPKGIREIFELTVSLKGTLSGEHGIGYVQKNYMDIAFQPVSLQLMKGIKNVFDPNGILNPGKVLPDYLS